jgi:MFS family permease
MGSSLRIRLSLMMLLQYIIWGCWFVAMGKYLGTTLGATAPQIGAAYANAWLGAAISPFFIGLIADRYFSAQKVMAVLHFLAAGVLFTLSKTTDVNAFIGLILLNSILYMPTVSLTNSIGFAHIPANGESESRDRILALVCWLAAGLITVFGGQSGLVLGLAAVVAGVAAWLTVRTLNDFPTLRVWGTIGWVLINLYVGLSELGATSNIFLIPAGVSIVLGIFSFFLPDTPPNNRAGGSKSLAQIVGLDALGIFKDRSYLTFFIGAILMCIPLAFYFGFTALFLNQTGIQQVEAKMSLGQMSEIGFMILLPLFLRRWGTRTILIVGMGAWVLRYFLLKYGNADLAPMLLMAVLLHGICYDFFFVTGQIYTDNKTEPALRSSAQGLFTIATYGIGMSVGSWLSGVIAGHYSTQVGDALQYDWPGLWNVPFLMAFGMLVVFALLFRDK